MIIKFLHRAILISAAVGPSAAFGQVIMRDSDISYIVHEMKPFIDIYSRPSFSTNALSESNLYGGLKEHSKNDVYWQNGLGAGFQYPIGSASKLFARGDIFHVLFFDNKNLNYFGLSFTAGAQVDLASTVSIYAAGLCISERTQHEFHKFYGFCGPTTGVSIKLGGDYRTGSYTDVNIGGVVATGKKEQYASYREINGSIRFRTSKIRVSLSVEPYGYARFYSEPTILRLGSSSRRDYRGGLRAGLYWSSPRVEIGAEANPSANWSNLPQYRYWDFRVGPSVRARF